MLFTTLLSFVPALWSRPLFGSIRQKPITDVYHNDQGAPFVIRNATLEDARDVARVLLDAFATVPYWNYLYQFKDQYPEYHMECGRRSVVNMMSDSSPLFDLIFHVIDAPVEATDGREVMRPASIAVWQVIHEHAIIPTIMSYDCADHLDLNITRAYDFLPKWTAIEERYVSSPHGDVLYLGALATHPDWQEHGMGPAHCRWGQAYARERAINISLVATPAGYPVYDELGFESIKNETLRSIDGDVFWWEGMKWTP